MGLKRQYRASNAVHQTDGVAGSSDTPEHAPVGAATEPDELEEWC
jgi:hypothetical protein